MYMIENSEPVPPDDASAAVKPGAGPDAGAFPVPLPRVGMPRLRLSGSGPGRRVLLLNPRRVFTEGATRDLVLLAFADVTGTGREPAP